MSFNTKLTDLLKSDPRFVDDEGELVLAAVQDRAWKIDRDLVKLLLSDKEIKAKFFDEIEEPALSGAKGHWIFNTNTFIDYVSQKNFLDNSYTRFRNRIGLTVGDQYLRERGDVALVWPYKDTVLEGGQTREEEKRKEIFFNEVLAQDEINRLLDPKVLTNFTRYTAKGKEPVKGFKRGENGVIRENLILKGNNLLALHTLKTQFRGQVKLIYIDPPYNTGNDSFGYNDSFNHSTWLTFMKNRLEVAYQLLNEYGMIYVQCDNTENSYLRVLLDDVFGRDNFVSQITWQRAPEGRTILGQGSTFITDCTEYILVYAKDARRLPSSCPLKKRVDATEKALNQYNYFFISEGQRTLHKTLTDARGNEIKIFKHIDFQVNRIPNKIAINERLQNFNKLVRIAAQQEESTLQQKILSSINPNQLFSVEYVPSAGKRKGQSVKSYYLNNGIILFLSDFAETDGERVFRVAPMNNFWSNDEIQITGIAEEGGVELRRGKKPEMLLHRIIQMSTDKDEIILDFHLGSGTTCTVAHKMGRQYIGIEQLDYGVNDSVVRLQNVINGDKSGISKSVNWQGGGEFVYCELMKYNEAFIERIQAAKSSKELLKIWQEMAEGSFLNWYVNPKTPEEAVKDFEALGKGENGLEKQKRLLAELLDKNQLYMNLSEIDDAQFKVSKEDKALNRAFYGEACNV
ncbi:MAG: site-specific DNA-methyltransferase [Bacteroidetes bacterium]|nr:site-specific DNA-methyltransferase [Bacteroidota bacterium]